jgi:hypothetical protein
LYTIFKMKFIKLYRPVGQLELDLIKNSDYNSFPPRLSWQPIFYPVLDYEYACSIARDWNTNDETNGNIGYVTQFEIPLDYFNKFKIENVGASNHNELWVPAEELENFNAHIQGKIKVVKTFYGDNYDGIRKDEC